MTTNDQFDIELTGYLDAELSDTERQALEARLDGDPDLRARLDLLAAARPTTEAFDILLNAAPRERLAAILDTAVTQSSRAPARGRFIPAAVAALILLAVGVAVGFGLARFALPGTTEIAHQPPGWRAAVADYMALYTDESLDAMPDDPAQRQMELANVGAKLDLDLTPANVELPDLTLKRASLLEFRNLPLAQITYRSQSGPVALCIIANGKPDAPLALEERDGWGVAFWTVGGLGYMVIGKVPAEELRTLAETVESRDL